MFTRSLLTWGAAALTVLCTGHQVSYADGWTQGYDGVTEYTKIRACPLYDVVGLQYVQQVYGGLRQYGVANPGTIYGNESVWKTDFTDGFADSGNWFAFSGHTYRADVSPFEQATMHLTVCNNRNIYHSWEWDPRANVTWDDVRLGYQARWATFYTCSWLNDRGSGDYYSQIWDMFRGLRIMNGFSTKMYVDSREGWTYASRVGNGWSIIDAFQNAALWYQPYGLSYGETDSSPQGYVIAASRFWLGAQYDDRWASPAATWDYWDAPERFAQVKYWIALD